MCFAFCLLTCLCLASAVEHDVREPSTEVECNTKSDAIAYILKRLEGFERREALYRQQIGTLERKVSQQQHYIRQLETESGKQQHDILKLKYSLQQQREIDTNQHVAEVIEQNSERNVRASGPDTNVAFFATLNADALHLQTRQNVVFDNVVTNVGSAYSQQTGVFVAPTAGTYVFSASLSAYGQSSSYCVITMNNSTLTTLFLNGSDSDEASGSATVVLQLDRGDEISVQNTSGDGGVLGGSRSMLSGFLLRGSADAATVIG